MSQINTLWFDADAITCFRCGFHPSAPTPHRLLIGCVIISATSCG
jgi:hypothetical protein